MGARRGTARAGHLRREPHDRGPRPDRRPHRGPLARRHRGARGRPAPHAVLQAGHAPRRRALPRALRRRRAARRLPADRRRRRSSAPATRSSSSHSPGHRSHRRHGRTRLPRSSRAARTPHRPPRPLRGVAPLGRTQRPSPRSPVSHPPRKCPRAGRSCATSLSRRASPISLRAEAPRDVDGFYFDGKLVGNGEFDTTVPLIFGIEGRLRLRLRRGRLS